MSYADMDHAEWVEENIAAHHANHPLAAPRRGKNREFRGWAAAPEKLSDFQARVMDILGMVGGGIYNAPISWDGVYWNHGGGMGVPWRGSAAFSTFDFDRLTRLVLLCHDARIRCEIQHNGPRGFLLVFHPRSHEGRRGERHPSIEEAVAEHRAYLPADHRIHYRAEQQAVAEALAEAAE